MRAELPALAGHRPLSPASTRALIEGLVRVGDVLAIAMAGIATAWWRFPDTAPPPSAVTAFLTVCLLAPQVLSWFCDYAGSRLLHLGWQLPRLLLGWLAVVALAIACLFALKLSDELSRLWLGLWLVSGAVALVVVRLGLRLALGERLIARVLTRRLAVIGLGEDLPNALARLNTPDPGLVGPMARVACALDLDGSLDGRWPRGVARLAGLAELEDRVRAGKVDQIVLALPPRSGELVARTLRDLRHLGVDVAWVSALAAARVPVLGTEQIGDVPMVRLLERPLDGWRWLLKGVEDRVLAALLLLLLAPLMLLIAIAIRLGSEGPVFYRQIRHGFNQEPISVFKFRTMYTSMCDAPSAATFRQATKGDPRVTPLGRFLRRTSLDELPQLINVVRGEMSLVGPRPHPVALDQQYIHRIDDYLCRHRVKPGITGWAQVNGYRGETTDDEAMRHRIEHDLHYIKHWSVFLDLRILWLTIFRGFVNPNAY